LQYKILPTPSGATAPSGDGRFTFDFAAFEPTSTITLVLISKAGIFNWDLSSEELALLP
jgi:hypothetical protein